MILNPQVVQRLLLSRFLLTDTRFHPASMPDSTTLGKQIIAAHDASELTLAAIAEQRNISVPSGKTFLMDYFDPLKALNPDGSDIPGKAYFKQLNQVRIDIKHHGILPDPKQWARVGENVYGYISDWCRLYLQQSFEELDLSSMIRSDRVRNFLREAKEALVHATYKEGLEYLALALHRLFRENRALRGLYAGVPRTEDAIKLTGFGVHANDFLALQEFLPEVRGRGNNVSVAWEQGHFGHPGNWQKENLRFCIDTFIDLALKIQDATSIPGPVEFWLLYDYRVVARTDLEIWNLPDTIQASSPILGQIPQKREVLRTLKQGESLLCQTVNVHKTNSALATLFAGPSVSPPESQQLKIVTDDAIGYVEAAKVDVKCVPRSDELIKESAPKLSEIDWQPD